ncbi:hypothetical protein NEF87_004028 [Candidatus Lokiarchaeum ossiferum]|uniref:DUF998 domain-containing protein n=1 Tax=Candidatus Lokiarchaeum ossiferum TaxID=2951803 RepID=A0ABY6HW35_9ARCH|nr:hypothetical protein NEF87_004028 [Candidatus Lokiarchaeum sp. B-35]
MADILPVPETLIFFHGLLKLIIGVVALIYAFLLIPKYKQKKSKITIFLLFTYIFTSLGMIFSGFDNFLGWDDLLGENTWLGFGFSQIFVGCANTAFIALYLEIFRVKENWNTSHYILWASYAILMLGSSTLIMTYYSFHWPRVILLQNVIFLLLSILCFGLWTISSTRILHRMDDAKYKTKFRSFQLMGISFILLFILFTLANLSDSPSFFTWFASFFMMLGFYFSYRGFLHS